MLIQIYWLLVVYGTSLTSAFIKKKKKVLQFVSHFPVVRRTGAEDTGLLSGRGAPAPGFSAASVCVRRQRSVKAVGNRNTMAATLSLTQVTLSPNPTPTPANRLRPPGGSGGELSAAMREVDRRENAALLRHSLLFFFLRGEVSSCCDWEKFLPNLFGDGVRA